MASLPGRVLASFQATIPVATLNDLDGEFNQYVGAAGIFNGGTTAKKLLVKTSDAADPPIEQDQVGAGPLAEWKQNGTLKVSIANTGQIVSAVTTGTAPFSVASATRVDNLNADLLDGFSSSDFASPAAHKTWWSITWFYPILPAAVESVESVGRLIVPQTNGTFTVRDCVVTWVGGSDSGANNIFTIKRRNSAGTLQADVGTANVNSASQNVPFQAFTSTLALSDADQIYPLFTTRNTASETVVSITLRGTQTFGTN